MKARITSVVVMVAASVLLLGVEPSYAQCAMCKAALEASSDAAALSNGLNLAALVLLIPPVSIFAGLFGLFYRFRNVQGCRQ